MLGFVRKLLGNRGEGAAARHLRSQGYRILARQWLTRWGEFDLIALDGETVVFVEVKTRRSNAAGHPAEAVTRDKQVRMTRQALVYLKRHRWLERRARFDVVAVVWPDGAKAPSVEHFRNAFEPVGFGQLYS
jgi:putative endonuclease